MHVQRCAWSFPAWRPLAVFDALVTAGACRDVDELDRLTTSVWRWRAAGRRVRQVRRFGTVASAAALVSVLTLYLAGSVPGSSLLLVAVGAAGVVVSLLQLASLVVESVEASRGDRCLRANSPARLAARAVELVPVGQLPAALFTDWDGRHQALPLPWPPSAHETACMLADGSQLTVAAVRDLLAVLGVAPAGEPLPPSAPAPASTGRPTGSR